MIVVCCLVKVPREPDDRVRVLLRLVFSGVLDVEQLPKLNAHVRLHRILDRPKAHSSSPIRGQRAMYLAIDQSSFGALDRFALGAWPQRPADTLGRSQHFRT